MDVDTISAWLDGWERGDTPAEAARLRDWLEAEPRQIKQAQARLEQATGKQASQQTRAPDRQKSLSPETAPTAVRALAMTQPSRPRTRAWASSGKATHEG